MNTMLFDVRGGTEMAARCECCREPLRANEEGLCGLCEKEMEGDLWDDQN